ncbi:class I SAM-dependent methyltransferase [Pseudonocardiaceae bacterium YIM PH 21723]|nr:class I SAM-dependent methyltransferase [Pseudonocardiaceae bacterium YIM PH 21723]
MSGLPLTGERTVPGLDVENYWFRRHEAAYIALRQFCAGAVVLEAGCGEGYGADLIAGVARSVLALDYDEQAIAHVRRTYPQVRAVRTNLASLPVAGGSVDVVANLQVIEHLWNQEEFLAECARVLRPGGLLLCTTPNRITFSPGRDTPLNPFHTRELSGTELDGLLADAGFRTRMLGLGHGPRLRELDARHGGSIIDAQINTALAGQPWSEQLIADVTSVTAADFVLSEDDIDASLDLVAIAERL